jgi:hypothetical protein
MLAASRQSHARVTGSHELPTSYMQVAIHGTSLEAAAIAEQCWYRQLRFLQKQPRTVV